MNYLPYFVQLAWLGSISVIVSQDRNSNCEEFSILTHIHKHIVPYLFKDVLSIIPKEPVDMNQDFDH